MVMEEESGGTMIEIKMTPTLNRFLLFLQDWVNQGSVDYSEIDELKQLISDEDRALVHFVLSAALKDEDLQGIISHEDNHQVFEDLEFILDPGMEKISAQMYVEIITGLDLVPECLSMIQTNPGLKVFQTVASFLVDNILEKNGQNLITEENWADILLNFIQICKLSQQYHQILAKLIDHFIKCNQEIKTEHKFVTFIRLILAALVIPTDYQSSDEISVLLNEWGLVELVEIKDSPTRSTYSTIFSFSSSASVTPSVQPGLVQLLDKMLPVPDMTKLQIENATRKYLGGCAYLIKMLIERHLPETQEKYRNICSSIDEFIESKPKMKEEEVTQGNVQDFSSFCSKMNKYGHRDVYKLNWTKKFMHFSPEEMLGTDEGQEILKKFIIGGSFDLILEMIQKLRQVTREFLEEDDARKELVLKLILEGRSKTEVETLIKEYFALGVHENLKLAGFKGSLHGLTLQLGNIEFETDPGKNDANETAVVKVFLQSPQYSTRKLLVQSILTRHFRVVNFLRPYFSLEPRSEDDQLSTLGKAAILNLVSSAPAYPNLFYEAFSSGLGQLLDLGLISSGDLFKTLQDLILKHLSTPKVALSKVVGLVVLLEATSPFIQAPDRAEMTRFVVNLNRFFCLFTTRTTFSSAVQIKSVLAGIIEKNPQHNMSPSVIRDEELVNMTLFEKGLFYIRFPSLQPFLTGNLKDSGDNQDLISYETFLIKCVLPWALNSIEAQWPSLISLLETLISPNSSLINLRRSSLPDSLHDSLLAMYQAHCENPCSDAFLYYFRFYTVTVDQLRPNFSPHDRFNVLNTLFTLACEIRPETPEKQQQRNQEIPGYFQILTFLLSKVEELLCRGGTQPRVKIVNCSKLIYKANKIPQVSHKYDPVRWRILEKIHELDSFSAAA